VTSTDELKGCLDKFDELKICQGCPKIDKDDRVVCNRGRLYSTPEGDYWRANDCSILHSLDPAKRYTLRVCEECYAMERLLKKKIKNEQKISKKRIGYQKLKNAKNVIARNNRKIEVMVYKTTHAKDIIKAILFQFRSSQMKYRGFEKRPRSKISRNSTIIFKLSTIKCVFDSFYSSFFQLN